MNEIVIPELYCPIPPAVNPEVERAQEHVQAWVCAFGLVRGEAALQRFSRARFGWLLARTYPKADPEALDMIVQWNTFLFLFDDLNDESKMSRRPVELRRLHTRLFAVLQGQVTPSTDDPFASGLADVWQRISAWATSDWKARFLQHVEDYFGACEWEATNRANGRIPTVQDYVTYRALTGAMQTAFDLSYLSEKITLPDVVREHPAVEALGLACTNVVCWANDIYSCHKELRQGDVHNLVVALQHEQALSLQAAFDQAARLHDEEMQRFLDKEQDLPRALEQDLLRYDVNIQRYVGVMHSWIRGNRDWSLETGRYYQHQATAAMPSA